MKKGTSLRSCVKHYIMKRFGFASAHVFLGFEMVIVIQDIFMPRPLSGNELTKSMVSGDKLVLYVRMKWKTR